jgi:hypothetical protein
MMLLPRLLLLLLCATAATAAAATPSACPAGFTLMAATANFTACEDHSKREGSLIFLSPAGQQLGEPIAKSAAAMYSTANNSYVPPPDVADPTLEKVMAEKQPMIHVGANHHSSTASFITSPSFTSVTSSTSMLRHTDQRSRNHAHQERMFVRGPYW